MNSPTTYHSDDMTKINLHINVTKEQLAQDMACAAAIVKLLCGVGNNAAWLVTLHAHDQAKRCKRYYHGNVRHEFRQVFKMFKEYERTLLYTNVNRFFHVADMSPDVRKKYGDISDADYYELWTGTGAAAYDRTKPLITSLWNKYRLSLLAHDVHDAEQVAWVMTAAACLELSAMIYKKAIEECANGMNLPYILLKRTFRDFDMSAINEKWAKAMKALAPEIIELYPSETEAKNIKHGLDQLQQNWTDATLLYNSLGDAVSEYREFFRTKNEVRKALKDINDLKQ